MKYALLMTFSLLLFGCKVEVEKSARTEVASLELNANQIGLDTDENNPESVIQFTEELERKQAENPDEIFEVVPLQKKSSNLILSGLKDDHLYKAKNFYILIGLGSRQKDEVIQKTDWEALYSIMNYLSSRNFRVMINVQATTEHLKAAVSDENTSVILWSSHGNKEAFYDYNGNAVPKDIFKNKSKNFYQFILSSCEGKIALSKYQFSGIKTWAWEGMTNSNQLKRFLLSDKWSALDGALLSPAKNNISCSTSGKKFSMIHAQTRSELYGQSFETLEECKEKVQAIKGKFICGDGPEGIKRINLADFSLSVEEYYSLKACQAN